MQTLKKDEVFETLRDRIVRLEYKPGEILNEVEIASELDVSRTPVRNAFQQLVNLGLLTIVPRYGTQVSQVDFLKMKQLFELTRVMDPFATRLAAQKISQQKLDELKEIHARLLSYDIKTEYHKAIIDDENFHEIIFEACGNPWLQKQLKELHCHSERLWHYCQKYFDDVDIFTYTFGKIIEAMEANNLDDVEKYARQHIDDFVEKIKGALL